MAQANIKLVTFRDYAMPAPIYYWVLRSLPSDRSLKFERVGPPYFTTIDDAKAWADTNGYRY